MTQDKPQNGETSKEQALVRLERQIERGSFFTHTALSKNADRIHEAESFLYGIIDLLVKKQLVTSEDISQSAEKVRQEMVEKGETVDPGIALRVNADEDKGDTFVPVNCTERAHVCKGVCCKLHFALTAEEVESGKIKWDMGQPYYIRHEEIGSCSHFDPDRKGCQIYEDRPTICRKYSCANDERIWKNFKDIVLNEDWINEYLGDSRPSIMALQMLSQEIVYHNVDAKSSADPGGKDE